MVGLTLYRPWDYAMAYRGKNIENRKWKPPTSLIGHRFALHAGKTYDYDGADFIKRTLEMTGPLPESRMSVIVATTLLMGWVSIAEKELRKYEGSTVVASAPLLVDCRHSPWFFGPYGWIVAETLALPKPVPCKGAQGLWTLPILVEAEVMRQERMARSAA